LGDSKGFACKRNRGLPKVGESPDAQRSLAGFEVNAVKNNPKNKKQCFGKAETRTPAKRAKPAANPAALTSAFVLPKTTNLLISG